MDATKLAKSVSPRLRDSATWKPWSEMVVMLLEGMPDDRWVNALHKDAEPTAGAEVQRIHRQVRSFLILTVDDLVQRDLMVYKSPKAIWRAAKARYGVASRLEISIYRSRFFGELLRDGESVEEYVREKRRIAAICNDAGKTIEESDLVDCVLAGCRHHYESVVENLSASSKLSLSELEARLRDAEQARFLSKSCLKSATSSKVLDGVMAASTKSCSECGKPGHVASKCWSLVPCKHCKKTGHPYWRCRFLRQNSEQQTSANSSNLASALLTALRQISNEPVDSSYPVGETIRSLLCRLGLSSPTIADSGSGKTLIASKAPFKTYEKVKIPISMAAEGSMTQTIGHGIASLDSLGLPSRSTSALHVPALGDINLLSVSSSVKGRRHMVMDEEGCELRAADGATEASGELSPAGLYVMHKTPRRICKVASSRSGVPITKALTANTASGKLFKPTSFQKARVHDRFCHRDSDAIMHLWNKKLVANIWKNTLPKDPCESCWIGKARKQPLPTSSVVSIDDIELAEILSTDICGKLPVTSIGGANYFITFIEHRSRMKFTFLLKTRSSLPILGLLKRVKAYIERRTGRRIQVLRYDNAGEFLSVIFQDYLTTEAIEFQRTVPHCSNQNQVSERSNLTLLDGARTLLYRARLPEKFWGLAVLCVSHVSRFWPHLKSCSDFAGRK